MRGFMRLALQNRQPAEDLSRRKIEFANRTDSRLHSEPACMRVRGLRALKLAQADNSHLRQATLQRAGETGVPFDPADQKNAIAQPRIAAHHRVDSELALPQR